MTFFVTAVAAFGLGAGFALIAGTVTAFLAAGAWIVKEGRKEGRSISKIRLNERNNKLQVRDDRWEERNRDSSSPCSS